MDEESFEKMDRAWSERLKSFRKMTVPSGVLRGFSAEVERRLHDPGKPERRGFFKRSPWRLWVPIAAPVFVALTLYVTVADQSGLVEEVAVLRELGVWTEEDEGAVEVSDEITADVLEAAG